MFTAGVEICIEAATANIAARVGEDPRVWSWVCSLGAEAEVGGGGLGLGVSVPALGATPGWARHGSAGG